MKNKTDEQKIKSVVRSHGVKMSQVAIKGGVASVKTSVGLIVGSVGLTIIIIIILIIIIISAMFAYGEVNLYADCDYGTPETENIEFLIPTIDKYLEEYNFPPEVKPLLYAQIHQESGDNPDILKTDPMQSSEYYCGQIGCIDNYEDSIKYGLELHKKNIDLFNLLEIGGSLEETVLQSYNFGSGYLYYLDETGKEQSEEIAYDYSEKMTKENPDTYNICPFDPNDKKACYGDFKYVEHVKMKGGYTCGSLDGELTHLPEKANTYYITQGYGNVGNSEGEGGWHDGIDLAGYDGAEVYSSGDGVVAFVGQDINGANVVKIKHSDEMFTSYAHLKYPSELEVGDKVEAGELVGYQGSTGNSTGSHLHFEVRKDTSWNIGPEYTDNPDKYLPLEENQIT